MAEEFILEGLAELEQGLMELSVSVAKRLGAKSLILAAEPLVDMASELAPVRSGYLETHIAASTKLSRRQRSLSPKQSDVEVYVGPSPAPQGVQQEFGNRDQPAQPFIRPAWDSTRMDVMFNIRDDLKAEIDKRAERARKRQARLLAKMQAGA